MIEILILIGIIILLYTQVNKIEGFRGHSNYKRYKRYNNNSFIDNNPYFYAPNGYYPPTNCMNTLFGGISCFPLVNRFFY